MINSIIKPRLNLKLRAGSLLGMFKIILFFPKLEEKDAILLPASVLMVAASLVKAGYLVKIIDQRIEPNWQKIILEELKKQPLIFGVSALTGKQILNGLAASRLVKTNSEVPVVWGGVHASLLSRQTLENKDIDFVVVGEGEETFLELVNRLKNKQSIEDVPGLGYKKGGEIFINSPRDFIDLNKQEPMPYDLINIEDYIAKKSFASGRAGRDIAFYTSRGCPHRCGFCYNQEFNRRRWRGKSAEKVVAEMKELVAKYGITAFNIEDDEFFVDVERAKKICELIIADNLNVEIFTSCRVNYLADRMDGDYLKLLYRAGFRTLAFGVESGSERILKLINKDITIGQVFAAIDKLKIAGINSKYYFMAGFPTEGFDDLYKTTDLIQKMRRADPQIRIPAWRIFTPYPGTGLYQLAIEQGWRPPQSLEEWADYDFSAARMPWLKGKKKKIIKNIAFLIDYLGISETKGEGIFFKLAKIFSKTIDWRWKRHLFFWAPEKHIIGLMIKIKRLIAPY